MLLVLCRTACGPQVSLQGDHADHGDAKQSAFSPDDPNEALLTKFSLLITKK